MGLPKKRHGVKIRLPECIGIGLLATFVAVCLLSYGQFTKLNWVKTKATVIGVTTPTPVDMLYSPISSTSNGLSVLYEFEAGSRLVKGSWSSNWLSTPIVKTLAPELINTIEEVKSVHIGTLPGVVAEELVANITGVRRKSLGGIMPSSVEPRAMRRFLAPQSSEPETSASGLLGMEREVIKTPLEINIRFDPLNPTNNSLNYPGFNFQIPVVVANLLMLLITLVYFGRTYPALKVRGF